MSLCRLGIHELMLGLYRLRRSHVSGIYSLRERHCDERRRNNYMVYMDVLYVYIFSYANTIYSVYTYPLSKGEGKGC